MRLLNWILFLLLLVLQYQLWFADGGLRQDMALSKKVAQQQADNLKLKQHNALLSKDVLDLQQGTQMIEEYARSELGMIKPAESFFLVVQAKHHEHK